MSNKQDIEFALFGARLGAFIIDIVINLVFLTAILYVLFVLWDEIDTTDDAVSPGFAVSLFLLSIVLIPTAGLLYRAIFECSPLQGTPGKALIGIMVVDTSGNRISFGKALLRNLVKILSSLIFYIGFLVALRDKRCLTWHDLAAGTYVISNKLSEDGKKEDLSETEKKAQFYDQLMSKK